MTDTLCATARESTGAVYRLLPIEEGAEAAARILMILESGFSEHALADGLGVSVARLKGFVEDARAGALTRHRFPNVDSLYCGPMPGTKRHPLAFPFYRAMAKGMLREHGICTGEIEEILIAAQKTRPVANFVSDLRKRLKPHGVTILSKYAGSFRTKYWIGEGRDALIALLIEAENLGGGE